MIHTGLAHSSGAGGEWGNLQAEEGKEAELLPSVKNSHRDEKAAKVEETTGPLG